MFSPHVFEVLAFFLAALGVALAFSAGRNDVRLAHWLFAGAFLLAYGRAAQGLLGWKIPAGTRYAVAFLVFGSIGIGWLAVYNWVEHKATKLDPPQPAQHSDSVKKKENRIVFAKLMDEGQRLWIRMYKSKDREEFDALDAQMDDWVARTFKALNESGLETNARVFCYSGNELSRDQIKAVAPDPCQPWKQYPMTKLAIYKEKLREIVERRDL